GTVRNRVLRFPVGDYSTSSGGIFSHPSISLVYFSCLALSFHRLPFVHNRSFSSLSASLLWLRPFLSTSFDHSLVRFVSHPSKRPTVVTIFDHRFCPPLIDCVFPLHTDLHWHILLCPVSETRPINPQTPH